MIGIRCIRKDQKGDNIPESKSSEPQGSGSRARAKRLVGLRRTGVYATADLYGDWDCDRQGNANEEQDADSEYHRLCPLVQASEDVPSPPLLVHLCATLELLLARPHGAVLCPLDADFGRHANGALGLDISLADVYAGLAPLERARRVRIEGGKRMGNGLLIQKRGRVGRGRRVDGVDGCL